MGVRNLDAIFRPNSVAVIGASNSVGSVGGALWRNLAANGFTGDVFPINPKHDCVQGTRAFASIKHVPQAPDLAVICVPAPAVPGVVRECGEAGVRGVIIISAGFREVGAAGRELEEAVHREAARFDGLRIVGPNCLGVIVPGQRLSASFAAGMPQPGRVALLSQSGALCTAILDWAIEQQIGFVGVRVGGQHARRQHGRPHRLLRC
jgi:acetyltransferase